MTVDKVEHFITVFRNIYESHKKNDNCNVNDRICQFFKLSKETIKKKDYEKMFNLLEVDVYNFHQVWTKIFQGENDKFVLVIEDGDEIALHKEGWVLQKFRLEFFSYLKTLSLYLSY